MYIIQNPFKTCANPQARDQNINRGNLYENEMVLTYHNLHFSGASPNFERGLFSKVVLVVLVVSVVLVVCSVKSSDLFIH